MQQLCSELLLSLFAVVLAFPKSTDTSVFAPIINPQVDLNIEHKYCIKFVLVSVVSSLGGFEG